ncbi:MFS transporter (plasmid) [Salinigranum rubrum]|uniref:MFS transporter n=2 Tax=Salinigranum rubrum TaxID=755307 RepID=A0A2I8VS15_9EURY|nr:MFS transporter [Salinigranum rubrum]
MIYPVLIPELRSSYGFDLSTAGLLLSLLWVSTAVGQLPGGIISDRFGEGWTLLMSVVISGVMLVLVISVNTVAALFALTVLLGLGLSLYGVARYTAMRDLFPNRVGFSVGIVLAAADIGQSLLPPIAGFLVVFLSWQFGLGFTLPFFVIAAIALWAYVPARTSTSASPIDSLSVAGFRTIFSGMSTPTIMYGTVLFLLFVSLWISFTSFYPTYLVEVKSLSSTRASLLFGAFFGAGVFVKPLCGAAYDRIGIRPTMLSIALVSGIALVVFPSVEGTVPILLITVLVAPILGSGTIVQSHLINALADEIKGTGLGVIRTIGLGLASIIPSIFGAAADRGFFDEGFYALAVLAVLMMVVTTRMPTN